MRVCHAAIMNGFWVQHLKISVFFLLSSSFSRKSLRTVSLPQSIFKFINSNISTHPSITETGTNETESNLFGHFCSMPIFFYNICLYVHCSNVKSTRQDDSKKQSMTLNPTTFCYYFFFCFERLATTLKMLCSSHFDCVFWCTNAHPSIIPVSIQGRDPFNSQTNTLSVADSSVS